MSKQLTRQPTKQERRKERSASQRRREQARLQAARRRRITLISTIVAVVLIVAVTAFFYWNGQRQNSSGQATAVSAPVNPQFPVVDNISCDAGEHNDVHYHAHVSIYINGKPVTIPQSIGIAPDNSCLYWLHTHSGDGVIHIESPANRTFTLGNFLHEWGYQFQSLGYPSQLASTEGWRAYVCVSGSDGTCKPTKYPGDINSIQLKSHELITLVYNSPDAKPDSIFSWNGL